MAANTANTFTPEAAPRQSVNPAADYAETLSRNDALALAQKHYPDLTKFDHTASAVTALNDLGQTVVIPLEALATRALAAAAK